MSDCSAMCPLCCSSLGTLGDFHWFKGSGCLEMDIFLILSLWESKYSPWFMFLMKHFTVKICFFLKQPADNPLCSRNIKVSLTVFEKQALPKCRLELNPFLGSIQTTSAGCVRVSPCLFSERPFKNVITSRVYKNTRLA